MNKLYFGLPLVIVGAFFAYYITAYLPEERRREEAAIQQKIEEEKARDRKSVV